MLCGEDKVEAMMEGDTREDEMGGRVLVLVMDEEEEGEGSFPRVFASLGVEREREERCASRESLVLFGCEPKSSLIFKVTKSKQNGHPFPGHKSRTCAHFYASHTHLFVYIGSDKMQEC
jgi:hypothetical protein